MEYRLLQPTQRPIRLQCAVCQLAESLPSPSLWAISFQRIHPLSVSLSDFAKQRSNGMQPTCVCVSVSVSMYLSSSLPPSFFCFLFCFLSFFLSDMALGCWFQFVHSFIHRHRCNNNHHHNHNSNNYCTVGGGCGCGDGW